MKIAGLHIGQVDGHVDPRGQRLVRRAAGRRSRKKQNEIAARILKEIRERLQLPDRRRPRLSDAVARLRHAVGRREPAHPARLADRLRPHRRALRARRAVDRPAPARQRAAAGDAQAPARPRQHGDRGRARRGRDPARPTTSSTSAPAPASTAAQVVAAGHARRDHGQPRQPHRPVPHRRAADPDAEAAAQADKGKPLKVDRRARATTSRTSPPRSRSACSPASPACRAAASPRCSSTRSTRPWRAGSTARASIPARTTRIEGLEHLDKVIDIDQSPIGRTPRSNPATYTGAFTPIRDWFAGLPEAKARGYEPGPLLLQRQGRALRGLPGRRRHQDRDALPARRLRHLRRLQGQALQPRDAGGQVQGQVDRRRARHDGRGGRRVLQGRAVDPRQAGDAGARRPRLHPCRPAGDHAVGRRGAARQARQGAVAPRHRAARSTSSTSRPPACTSTTSRSCSRCCTSWSTPATRWW